MHCVPRFGVFVDPHRPVAADKMRGDGSTTWQEDFSGWWGTFLVSGGRFAAFDALPAIYRDDVLKRDMSWIRSIHPNVYTVERFVASCI